VRTVLYQIFDFAKGMLTRLLEIETNRHYSYYLFCYQQLRELRS
jgi:hypothetical protein